LFGETLRMTLKARYARAMEWLYIACIAVSGTALVLIALAIPYGVLMRYGLDSAVSWPEPFAVILMVLFSFVGGAAVFRANAHIAVRALLDAAPGPLQRVMRWLIEAAMIAACLFMVVYGIGLAQTTWHQGLAEFPDFPVGLSYAPIPLGGLITLLFIVEKLWAGDPPKTSLMYRDAPPAAE
jgi:TRAP-type C4-dicarboxylate transport system permease small subunit